MPEPGLSKELLRNKSFIPVGGSRRTDIGFVMVRVLKNIGLCECKRLA